MIAYITHDPRRAAVDWHCSQEMENAVDHQMNKASDIVTQCYGMCSSFFGSVHA